LLTSALPPVQNEPQTTAWFAAGLGPSRFAIFDTFPDDAGGREAHLGGRVAAALMERASDLVVQPPSIENAEILAEKLS
jgi:hypothetical protein